MDNFAQTAAPQNELFDDFNGEESMQTRAQDDLFGDDFEPITDAQPAEELTPTAPQAQAPEPAPAPVPKPAAASSPAPITRGRGGAGVARGRGRGRGGHTAPTHQSRDTSSIAAAPASSAPPAQTPPSLLKSRHAPSPPPAPVAAPASTAPASNAPANAPTEPRSSKSERPTSVRGDRMATGGTARPKLTEEELSARLASVKLKNATLEAAHARAEADAASFAAREDEAAKRRTVERRDRQQMMGEREKNRLRKLKAQQGREWDSEKREEDFAEKRRGGERGCAEGRGQAEWAECPSSRGLSRSSGKKGRSKGRGRDCGAEAVISAETEGGKDWGSGTVTGYDWIGPNREAVLGGYGRRRQDSVIGNGCLCCTTSMTRTT
ncbi:hypothetical protein K461DRAFT_122051 [Myriangium duriaei CBS 260.36]|uniref:Uncharacterized protein n=1 Tax=Myriangium duriaei CBS 260.36 TaxID=1168546 RepID=A0A9P4MLD3_9PEZI|nr:hypothetical protein K461DRAFT_122051 [Myriangium duriaei CBS 260.36]